LLKGHGFTLTKDFRAASGIWCVSSTKFNIYRRLVAHPCLEQTENSGLPTVVVSEASKLTLRRWQDSQAGTAL